MLGSETTIATATATRINNAATNIGSLGENDQAG